MSQRKTLISVIETLATLPDNPKVSSAAQLLMQRLDELPALETSLAQLCEGCEVSDKRRSSLELAAELGAPEEVLVRLRDARRLRRGNTILLPQHRYEGLSRGRGWARSGKGPMATWGTREGGAYRVGPGHWIVGATDGFSRKGSTEWEVRHVQVGDQVWTIAD